MLAAGERGAIQDSADQGHRVVARIVAVGLRAGEELIHCVAGSGGIDLKDGSVAIRSSRRSTAEEQAGRGNVRQRAFGIGAIDGVGANATGRADAKEIEQVSMPPRVASGTT